MAVSSLVLVASVRNARLRACCPKTACVGLHSVRLCGVSWLHLVTARRWNLQITGQWIGGPTEEMQATSKWKGTE